MYKLLFLGIALAALFGLFSWQKYQIEKYKRENVQLIANNNILQFNQKLLEEAVKFQNNKIDIAAQEGNANKNEINKLQQDINRKEIQHKENIKRLLNEQAPQNCEESLIYLNKMIKEIQW